MNEKDQFHKLQEFFANSDQNYHVLEEQIPVETQMAYFKQSKVIKQSANKDSVESWIEALNNSEATVRAKKNALLSLASFQEVEYYRVLEKYRANPDDGLKNWAVMALNESRMGLEGLFSEEKQVFISTGLGGKVDSLRYFLVVIPKNEKSFSEFEIGVVKKEFSFVFGQHESEIEQVLEEKPSYVSMLVMIPIKNSLREILSESFDECNQFGGFLNDRFVVTNVKIMSDEEISDFLEGKDSEEDDFEEIDLA